MDTYPHFPAAVLVFHGLCPLLQFTRDAKFVDIFPAWSRKCQEMWGSGGGLPCILLSSQCCSAMWSSPLHTRLGPSAAVVVLRNAVLRNAVLWNAVFCKSCIAECQCCAECCSAMWSPPLHTRLGPSAAVVGHVSQQEQLGPRIPH
jgi:hypothetical protein